MSDRSSELLGGLHPELDVGFVRWLQLAHPLLLSMSAPLLLFQAAIALIIARAQASSSA